MEHLSLYLFVRNVNQNYVKKNFMLKFWDLIFFYPIFFNVEEKVNISTGYDFVQLLYSAQQLWINEGIERNFFRDIKV